MRITKFGHSCLFVEEGEARILIDPGNPEYIEGVEAIRALEGLAAILITHEHGDHADAGLLKELLIKNSVPVYSNGSVKRALGQKDIEIRLVDNQIFRIGSVQVEAVPASHGPIFRGAPENTAYILDGKFLVPGDSLDERLLKWKGISGVALPIAAPWMKEVEATAFVEKLLPKHVLPVHDGVLLPAFREGKQKQWKEWLGERRMEFQNVNLEL